MRTVSPTFAEFSSSWAFRRVVRVTILPYTGCGTRRSIATTTVFSILSLTTSPTRVLREARSRAAFGCVSAIDQSLLSPGGLGGFLRRAARCPLPVTRCRLRGRFRLLRHRLGRRARSLLGQDRLEPRDVLADHAKAKWIFQRLSRAPKAQTKPLLL